MIQKLLNAGLFGLILLAASSGVASGQTVISIAGDWYYSRSGTLTLDIDGTGSTYPDNGSGTLTISQSGTSIGWNYGTAYYRTGTIQGRRIQATGPFENSDNSISFSQNTYTAQGVLSDDNSTITLTGSGLAVGTSSGYPNGLWHWTFTGTDTTILTRKTPLVSLAIAPIPVNGRITGQGVSCGTGGTGDCSGSVASGTTVTLTAEPAPGYQMGTWVGCPGSTGVTCTLTLTQAQTVSASFTLGAPDLLWQHQTTGAVIAWYMDGPTLLDSKYLYQGGLPDWKVVGEGDFNGDGKADLLWQNETTGAVIVWYMDGPTMLDAVYLYHGGLPDWKVVGGADFNGDGKADLLWQNETSGAAIVWYMDGPTMLDAVYLYAGGLPDWKVVGGADFNGDGKADLLWQNKTTGAVIVWYLDGMTLLGSPYLYQGGLLDWKVVGSGDFNGDGKPDLLWQNRTTGAVIVWYMDGPTMLDAVYLYAGGLPDWKVVGPK
jgi:hypothetical protein